MLIPIEKNLTIIGSVDIEQVTSFQVFTFHELGFVEDTYKLLLTLKPNNMIIEYENLTYKNIENFLKIVFGKTILKVK